MIKQLLSLAVMATLTLSASADTVTLWQTGDKAEEGDGSMATGWGTALLLSASSFESAEIADVLTIHYTAGSGVQLGIKAGWDDIYPAESSSTGSISQILTSYQLNALQASGLRISGSGALTVTKIELTENDKAADYPDAIWIGIPPLKIGEYSPSISFTGAFAKTLKVGDTITVNYTKDDSEMGCFAKYVNPNWDWVDFDDVLYKYTDTSCSFVITDEMVDAMSDCQGFVIQGKNITVSSVDKTSIPMDVTSPVVVWEGTSDVSDWSKSQVLDPVKFESAQPGDKVTIYFTAESGAQIKIASRASGWPAITSNKDDVNSYDCYNVPAGATSYSFVLNEADAKTAKTVGLVLQGEKITYTKVVLRDSTATAITEIEAADENAPVEYFNLQGVRVENPTNGLYIRRQGNKVTKVII